MATNEESAPPALPTSQTGEDPAPLSWETLFDAIEDGVCVQSLDSRIICANNAFANIIGLPLSERDRDNGAGGEVVIEAEGKGRGIPEEDLSRIFSPFFGTNPNGAGLGLPAVRRVARAHGGRVEVTSTPGRGSNFTIRLPREPMAIEDKYVSHE
jgi:signal transduction histidine kinase